MGFGWYWVGFFLYFIFVLLVIRFSKLILYRCVGVEIDSVSIFSMVSWKLGLAFWRRETGWFLYCK